MDWQKIFNWLLLLFAIYIIIEILRKIFGGSLGFEELVTALLVMNISATFTLHSKMNKINARLSEHLGWHKGHEKKTA